jgi:hypothetical protein
VQLAVTLTLFEIERGQNEYFKLPNYGDPKNKMLNQSMWFVESS